MQPHEIVDRLTILYGNKHPIINSLERIVNTEELSDIFTLSSYLLGKEHRETVSALKNLIYERKSEDNLFVLFKIIDAIRDDIDALDDLRNISSSGLNIPVFSGQLNKLFRIITAISDNKGAINALQNVCDSSNFAIGMQTELLFKLIINLNNRDEEIISAIKNLVSTNAEPDMFLLFKVLQAIDPDNEFIGTLKSATIYKTNILKLAHKLTEEKYIIPLNMNNMIKNFEGKTLTDAFSRGQLRSKIWISDTINDLDIDLGDMVYVCAGWYGVLPALLFERNKVDNIRSFDIDSSCALPSETLNRSYTQNDWLFKASTMNIKDLIYTGEFMYETLKYNGDKEMITDGAPSCVINTSCEHIEDFDDWWNDIPKGMLVIMQNNDFDEDHEDHDDTVVNTVSSIEEWSKRLNVSETLYEGTLALDKYNRYMIIGYK
tara:strand:+ start:144 stop:1442 length:1299 start_codon:yes stop_codon:yes gene_type:complete